MKQINNILVMVMLAMILPCGVSASEPYVKGTLPNGLTYYIMHNENPAGQADFFLARGIGSINEEESERGLAHFLEHLCFNGTRHFPGNSLILWLESKGVKFGADLNAYTGADETVYNISHVPVGEAETVDSCLMILRDWSDGLTLTDADIEAERGVIASEWRHRNTASNRILTKIAPKIYPGSRYGERMPIGLLDVIENFPPRKLREFYDKWNDAANEAIVIVGDIDVADMENKIKNMFADMEGRDDWLIYPDKTIPGNEKLIAAVGSDPEQATDMVQLYFKARSDGHKGHRCFGDRVLSGLLVEMLVNRFDAAEAKVDAPYANVGVGYTGFLLARNQKSLTLRANSPSGDIEKTLAGLYAELRRARLFGFSADEINKAKSSLLKSYKEKSESVSERDNTALAKALVRSYLDKYPVDDPVDDYKRLERVIGKIESKQVEAFLSGLVNDEGRNAVAIAYATPSSAKADLAKAYMSVNSLYLEPFAVVDDLMDIDVELPAPGTIVSERVGKFGQKVLTLSNGLKVNLMSTKNKEGQIYMRGVGPGGISQVYTPVNAPEYKMLNDAAAITGAGRYGYHKLKKWIEGKHIRYSTKVSNTEESVEFAADRAVLEDAFKLMWLKITDLAGDKPAYEAYAINKYDRLKNKSRSPIQEMGDSITAIVYARHPLAGNLSAEQVKAADYDKMLEIQNDRFGDLSDFTFYLIGDFDTDSIRQMVCRYLAVLPTGGRIERACDIGYRFMPGPCEVEFGKECDNPQTIVYQFRHADCPYTLDNIIKASAANQILKKRLLGDLREDKGWTYSITTHAGVVAGMNGDDRPRLMMPVYVKTKAGKHSETSKAINSAISDMANDVSSVEVEAVKKYMLKNIVSNRKDNAYWLLVMRAYDRHGQDLDSEYERLVDSLTPEAVSTFVGDKLANADLVEITLR